MELRGSGSLSTHAAPPSCSPTSAVCPAPVTTIGRPSASGPSRSTVCCSSDRPTPVGSSRNLGRRRRESGHSRVPAPPAGRSEERRVGKESRWRWREDQGRRNAEEGDETRVEDENNKKVATTGE